jgi:mono/diheme cytochrome c family protein
MMVAGGVIFGGLRLITGLLVMDGEEVATRGATTEAATTATRAAGKGDVREVFVVKCGECHGETVKRPRGGFGYVTDLERLAGSELVVKGKPGESTLWQMIENGEMPAAGGKGGTLTDSEKEEVRGWIAGLR